MDNHDDGCGACVDRKPAEDFADWLLRHAGHQIAARKVVFQCLSEGCLQPDREITISLAWIDRGAWTDFALTPDCRKLERDNADLNAAVAAQAVQLTEERERSAILTRHFNRAERLAANRLERIRELSEENATQRRRIAILLDEKAALIGTSHEQADEIEFLKRKNEELRGDLYSRDSLTAQFVDSLREENVQLSRRVVALNGTVTELRDTVQQLAMQEPSYGTTGLPHSCPPPLGNPTREEAIEALQRIRDLVPLQLPTEATSSGYRDACDALTNIYFATRAVE